MKNSFKIIILLLFGSYLVLIFAIKFGYYETKEEKVKNLTEKEILRFEEDIKNGKEIDIEKYIVNDVEDYSTAFSNVIYKTSVRLEKVLTSSMDFAFDNSKKMVTN